MKRSPHQHVPLASDRSATIRCLAEASRLALSAGSDPWQFALELPALLQEGATRTELRWFVQTGVAEHGQEITDDGSSTRKFRRTTCLYFTAKSCFVLATAGKETPTNPADRTPRRPIWDPETRQLSLGKS